MTPNDRRKIRKIFTVLGVYRDKFAKENETSIASKFARAMALLMDILDEDAKAGDENDG